MPSCSIWKYQFLENLRLNNLYLRPCNLNVAPGYFGFCTLDLTDAGFEVTQKDTFSDSYPIGIVIAQKPETPELVKGGKVTLTVSKGPEKIKVPSGVLKLDEGKAVKLLEDYGFTVKVLKPAKTPKGKKLTVIKVTPNEGALVKPNSEITIELK